MKVISKKSDAVTMTVAEIKEKLSEYPDDMPVIATWEGVAAWITTDNFSVSENGYYQEPTLEIDVESH